MSKELLLVVDAVAAEKGVPESVILEAIEAALASAAKKRYAEQDVLVRVQIDPKDGSYETFRRWEVVADDVVMESPDRQVRLMDAVDESEDAEVGDYIEEQIENPDFGRIAAQAAKQVIVQRVREAERAQVVDAWKDRVGELVTGVVKRVERGNIYVDLGGNAEAIIAKDKGIPRDVLRTGDRVRGYLFDVRSEPRGPQLFISRAAPEFMMELFKLEVPEVGQGLVSIMACARDPGDRAKIAVLAHDNRTDPIGACIGMRGSRVQAVTNELNGERVDIILWSDNAAQFVINAMAPAEVQSIIVDEDKHSMDLAVAEDKLAQAIGRGGQNVRLASRLTGWQLNVMTADQVQAKSEAEQAAARHLFIEEAGSGRRNRRHSGGRKASTVARGNRLRSGRRAAGGRGLRRGHRRGTPLPRPRCPAQRRPGGRGGVGRTPAHRRTVGARRDGRATPPTPWPNARRAHPSRTWARLAADEVEDVEGMDGERAAALIMEARKHWFE
jgi:N utilization substance protein A